MYRHSPLPPLVPGNGSYLVEELFGVLLDEVVDFISDLNTRVLSKEG